MSGAHQRTAVTAGQANERSQNTNPLTKKSLCHISEGLPPSSPAVWSLHVSIESSLPAIIIKSFGMFNSSFIFAFLSLSLLFALVVFGLIQIWLILPPPNFLIFHLQKWCPTITVKKNKSQTESRRPHGCVYAAPAVYWAQWQLVTGIKNVLLKAGVERCRSGCQEEPSRQRRKWLPQKWITGMTEAWCVPLKTNLGRLVGAVGFGIWSQR